MIKIFPSLLAADFLHLADDLDTVSTADGLHLDIMDGVFVPNISFGPAFVRAVHSVTDLPLHSHLMIVEPWKYIEAFAIAGSKLICVHLETVYQRSDIFETVRARGIEAGLSFNPDVPVERSFPFLDRVDQVLVMSVFAGFGGQKFIPESLLRIEKLAEHRIKEGRTFSIAVDGGVGASNASQLANAGADVLVAGTSVFGAADRRVRIEELRSLQAGD